MVDAEATQVNAAPDGAPLAPIPDWSDVRGFQVLSASGSESAAEPDGRAVELAKELSTRAARFAQSVDDSILLSSDGLVRWLGDPIARLVGGEDILKPRGVLLADDALTGDSREAVETRLALWISAHVRKVLGPLEALAEPGALADPPRELAQRIVQALGVLERERVRQQVKSLDQNARATLRKLGVRFGALYIYVPLLLKPGARTLCSQLWGLRRGVEPGSERLLAFAASGRTSFAAEAPLGPDTYRVAGFRLCGDRVVRVDIVERLTDLIRAAIPEHMRPGGRPPSEAYGFVVSPQMTSLTGCAGDSFASILRSLGFESHRVKRADFEAATRRAPKQPIAQADGGAPVSADVAPEAPRDDEHRDVEASDAGAPAHMAEVVEAADLVSGCEALVAPPTEADATFEPPAEAEAIEEVARSESAAAVGSLELPVAEAEESLADVVAPEIVEEPAARANEAAAAESLELPVAEAEESLADMVAPASGEEPATDANEAAAAAEEPSLFAADADARPPDAAEPVNAAAPASVAETAEPTTVAAEGSVSPDASAPAEDEWIEIWRPAPRRRPQPAARPVAPARQRDGVRRPPGHQRDSRRHQSREPEAQSGPAVPAPEAAASGEVAPEASRQESGRPDRGENRRHRFKGPRPEDGRATDAPRGSAEFARPAPKKEPRAQPVDMDSPFAKLLALKPLLERRDKRT
jgi:ATP-dependent RNA helicase SUPV3L1/SUV3